MAPIFEDGNNKKDPPREEDLFETHSPGSPHSLPVSLRTTRLFPAWQTLRLPGYRTRVPGYRAGRAGTVQSPGTDLAVPGYSEVKGGPSHGFLRNHYNLNPYSIPYHCTAVPLQ